MFTTGLAIFLGSPRLYGPLLDAIKLPFFETAAHYEDLGAHGSQYAALLTFAALDPGDTFTKSELVGATRSLPADGLRDAAHALVRGLEGAGDQRADYWKSRIVPYIKSIWPTSRSHVSPSIADSLARLCAASGEAFPEAVDMLRPWLIPLEYPEYAIHRLHDARLAERFPRAALDLLAAIVGDQTQHPPTTLPQCLGSIRSADPGLIDDPRFEALSIYLRRHG